MKDVSIEDKGDIATVGFQTEKAKVELKNSEGGMSNVYGDDELPKVDVAVENQSALEAWCDEKELTFEYC